MNIKIIYYLMYVNFLTILLFLGCNTTETTEEQAINEFPVILYVSSEVSNVNPVNISVNIDHKNIIVDKDFYAGNGNSTFKLNLKKGQHQIVVESNNGNAGLDVVFTVDKPIWLSLSYWGKNHFQLNISYQPLVFI